MAEELSGTRRLFRPRRSELEEKQMTQQEIIQALLDNDEVELSLAKANNDAGRSLFSTLVAAKAEYQQRKKDGVAVTPATALTPVTATTLGADLTADAELDGLLQRTNTAATASLRTALAK